VVAVDVRLDFLAIARQFAAHPAEWPVAPRFNPQERWYHRLAAEPDFEVWLLTWLPGQSTDLHDHGGSAGGFHVYSGTLTEDTVELPDSAPPKIISRDLGDGVGRRFGTHHIHRIVNRSSRPAVSVHAYGPALSTMTKYRVGAAGLDVVTVEKAGVQW
jgi:predicted metal-dependent enzyme (double-stranded beta helix superfamily)